MNDKEKNISCTVAIPESDRDFLVRLAEKTGHNRTHPVTRETGGNLSWGVNEAISYFRHNFHKYLKEQTARLASEFEEGRNG